MKGAWIVATLFLAALTSACGGGGGSSHTSTVTPLQPATTVTITSTGLLVGIVNRQYGDTVRVTTSSGSSTVSLQGTLPPGLTLGNGGVVEGIPTQLGNFPVTFVATSALTPSVTASKILNIQIVGPGSVRNDSLAGATALSCCGNLRASLSPYAKATGVVAADNDWYRITATAGDRISLETSAIGTAVDTDTVIEIMDANGARMNVCKTPQASAAFTQPCINDDINPGVVRGSHLDVQLPQSSGVFVVRVFDLLGRARPEMTYELRTAKLP